MGDHALEIESTPSMEEGVDQAALCRKTEDSRVRPPLSHSRPV